MDKLEYKPIGIIHTPFDTPQGTPIQPAGASGTAGSIEIFPEFSDGLEDLDGFSHIILLFHLHLITERSLSAKPPFDDKVHGVFATRSPRRPNSIGMTISRLLRIKGNILHIQDVDMIDGTPLLDIKPYIPKSDSHEEARIGWLEGKFTEASETEDQ